MKKPRKLKPICLVRFAPRGLTVKGLKKLKYPFKADRIYVFLGEIHQMPGHCVVADHKTGKIYSGYHTENFSYIPQDEC